MIEEIRKEYVQLISLLDLEHVDVMYVEYKTRISWHFDESILCLHQASYERHNKKNLLMEIANIYVNCKFNDLRLMVGTMELSYLSKMNTFVWKVYEELLREKETLEDCKDAINRYYIHLSQQLHLKSEAFNQNINNNMI